MKNMVVIPTKILLDPELKDCVRLYAYLAGHGGHPNQEEIADALGVSVPKIKRDVKLLKEKRWINIHAVKIENGRKTKNHYYLPKQPSNSLAEIDDLKSFIQDQIQKQTSDILSHSEIIDDTSKGIIDDTPKEKNIYSYNSIDNKNINKGNNTLSHKEEKESIDTLNAKNKKYLQEAKYKINSIIAEYQGDANLMREYLNRHGEEVGKKIGYQPSLIKAAQINIPIEFKSRQKKELSEKQLNLIDVLINALKDGHREGHEWKDQFDPKKNGKPRKTDAELADRPWFHMEDHEIEDEIRRAWNHIVKLSSFMWSIKHESQNDFIKDQLGDRTKNLWLSDEGLRKKYLSEDMYEILGEVV